MAAEMGCKSTYVAKKRDVAILVDGIGMNVQDLVMPLVCALCRLDRSRILKR